MKPRVGLWGFDPDHRSSKVYQIIDENRSLNSYTIRWANGHVMRCVYLDGFAGDRPATPAEIADAMLASD